jgi:class 3 adenylate cyclase
MDLTCERCGTQSPSGFKFCGNCGAPFAAAPEPGPSREERRVVTVLFADLVGFTSRAEQLDPEDVRAMLTPYYATLREQIESFGGTVEKFIGDAVVGVFGAPVAHGDDPERGVRAALEIRERVSRMKDLQVRVGVNTGEAIVALDARTNEGEGMVAGDIVNTAARLQTAARTGEVLVGEETFRCTSATIEYEALDPVQMKGKEEPVPAWRVTGVTRAPGERAASDVQMVGRARELATLDETWMRALEERRPQLVTIIGLAGVGKSRLAAEFMKATRDAGARVVFGRSVPYGASSAYDGFAQQIRTFAGVLGDDSADAAAEKVRAALGGLVDDDEVFTHLGIMLGVGNDDGEVRDRSVLFSSARRVVQALAEQQPTVLVFQDLHWADTSLLDLIESLATRIEDAPLLLLTAARPELRATRPDWGTKAANSVTVTLEALGRDESRELAERLLARGTEKDMSQTPEQIAEAGEGNPLFIEELVASLVERSATATALPTSIRGIIAARLDAIPPEERDVLLNAAVVGRVFWMGALSRLSGHGAGLVGLLDSLERRDLIRREGASRFRGQEQYRFKHSLIRDVAYAALPRAKRRAAHGVVAGFLEELNAANDSPAVLGQHWIDAGEPERAIGHFIAAADQASRGWAKQEAVALYRQALGLLPDEDERRGRVRMKLAIAQQMVFHLEDVDSARRASQSGA